MAKMGRPKVEEVKDKVITMRVTPAEYQKIKEYAQTHNLTITQVLQKGVEKLLVHPDAGTKLFPFTERSIRWHKLEKITKEGH